MRIGIAGYGNLGKALERLAEDNPDVEIRGVYTRRNKEEVVTDGAPVYSFDDLYYHTDEIDVLALCYGSSTDLPRLTPELSAYFNTVDAFDNHSLIDEYKRRVDSVAKASGKTSVIALGWDPGLLSLMRLYFSSFLPNSSVNTFWGRGVSQGHSEALRRIDGVKQAIQYTVPREDALTLASLVAHPLSNVERHRRVCYIVAEKGKEDFITREVLSMENYFAGYEVELHFISEEEMHKYHSSMTHRGRIYALGMSGRYKEVKHSAYLDLDIGSNPDLTASVMLAGARAAHKLSLENKNGAYTVFDIPPSYFAPKECKNVNNYL
ncbi:MAG: diaminopimelate dehydrogenase [Clostridia bacterium]|nr:diaminopimelate dehydrogenase [Clostridia bacterium]